MTFSNPAGNAAGAAAAYVRALLDLLGPRDPLVVMRELLPWLEPPASRRYRAPVAATGGPRQVVGHRSRSSISPTAIWWRVSGSG